MRNYAVPLIHYAEQNENQENALTKEDIFS